MKPRGGWAVRARWTIESLAAVGCRVTVVSTEEPEGEDNTDTGVIPEAMKIVTLRRPLRWGFSSELVEVLKAESRQWDAVVIESAMFLPAVMCAKMECPLIWDTNEAETLHYRRRKFSPTGWIKCGIWEVLEWGACRRAAAIVAISEVEADWWKTHFKVPSERVLVVPHLPWLRDPKASADATHAMIERYPELHARIRLLFVGNVSAKHNYEAAAWLIKVLWPRLPEDVALILAGPGTDRLSAIRPRCTSGAPLLLLGAVDNIDTVIRSADFTLAPLASGAGVKTKVLHYLAHHRPVIGTPTAFEGIPLGEGMVCISMENFVSEVLNQIARLRQAPRGSTVSISYPPYTVSQVYQSWNLVLRQATSVSPDGMGWFRR
ncbi:MAG: glycosyltransferase family 4 protein [Firmicutes bacterium]|nr:glycosyltransferase family 4 protein [Bacillota bacterium]